jgi:hypothetical protein
MKIGREAGSEDLGFIFISKSYNASSGERLDRRALFSATADLYTKRIPVPAPAML